jgi:hypothetical protein
VGGIQYASVSQSVVLDCLKILTTVFGSNRFSTMVLYEALINGLNVCVLSRVA